MQNNEHSVSGILRALLGLYSKVVGSIHWIDLSITHYDPALCRSSVAGFMNVWIWHRNTYIIASRVILMFLHLLRVLYN